eukprot:SAG11_NODE_74_length_18043_cov_13.387818_13_plen_89_part_00
MYQAKFAIIMMSDSYWEPTSPCCAEVKAILKRDIPIFRYDEALLVPTASAAAAALGSTLLKQCRICFQYPGRRQLPHLHGRQLSRRER